ncbi:MAG: hypothetical protein RLZZ214_3778, partial [Verrucomicrobiota bacterium]
MQAPDPIETILARLMPPALSQDCQGELEEMIDELAGPAAENVVAISSGRSLVRWGIGGGIAAALAGLLAIFPLNHGSSVPQVAAKPATPAGFVLVSESDRIESMTDEGWQENSDGSAMHALRLSAVEVNNVRDTESGMLVVISEPREEILYTPI